MEKLKVLFLTYVYPPQQYPRSVQISHLVGYLRDQYSLRIVTSNPERIGDPSLLTFTSLDNVDYAQKTFLAKFVETSKGYRIKKAILPDLQYLWHFDLYTKTKEIIKNFGCDILVTFGQPMSTHIAGLKLKKKYPHLKWLAHFSDPWVDNLFNDYNPWVKFINTCYQDAVFRNADKLIFTSLETMDLVMKRYLPNICSKALWLPHAFNETLYCEKKEDNPLKNHLIIRYLGNFYGARQPDCLLKALKYLPKEQLSWLRIEFVGAVEPTLEKKIKKYGLENTVFVRGMVSYRCSLEMMKTSDMLLIIDAPTDKSPFLPSKLMDYIGAGKPIFGITPAGSAQRLIEEMGFLVADPSNPDEIAKKMSEMIGLIKTGKQKIIPTYIRDRYSIQKIGGQMTEILKGIANASPCTSLS